MKILKNSGSDGTRRSWFAAIILIVIFALAGMWVLLHRNIPVGPTQNKIADRKEFNSSDGPPSGTMMARKSGRPRVPRKTTLPGKPSQPDPSEEQDPFAPVKDGIDYKTLLARTWIKTPMVFKGVVPVKEVADYYKLDKKKIAKLGAIMLEARKEIADLVQKEAKEVESGKDGTLVYEFPGNPAKADEIRRRFLDRVAKVAGDEFAANSGSALDNGFLRGGRVTLRFTCVADSSTKQGAGENQNAGRDGAGPGGGAGRIIVEFYDENGNRAGRFSGSAEMIRKKTMLDFDLGG